MTEQEIVEEFSNNQLMFALETSVDLQSHYAKVLNMHDEGHRREFTAKSWLSRLMELGTLPVPSEASGEGDFVMVDRVANEELRRICIENADEIAALHTALRELAEVSKRMKEALGLSFEGLDDYWVTTPDGSYAWHEIHSSRADYTDWLSRHRSLLDGAPKKEATP